LRDRRPGRNAAVLRPRRAGLAAGHGRGGGCQHLRLSAHQPARSAGRRLHRADGHTVLLPQDEGEGQQMERKPGNLYSLPQPLHWDPRSGATLKIALTQKIPPIPPPPDTEWIKHVVIQSQLLTQFWGQPMFLKATVVLPEGFHQHPDAHYPVMVEQNHFNPDLARAFRRIEADWTSGKLPKFLWVDINHANPYYDDSYAVDSANLGPYGD